MKHNTSTKRTGIILNLIAVCCFMLSNAQEDYTKELKWYYQRFK